MQTVAPHWTSCAALAQLHVPLWAGFGPSRSSVPWASPRKLAADACLQERAVVLCGPQFGKIVMTTAAGIMDHEEARRKKIGGKVLGFFY